MPTIFADSSVLIAALYSQRGASYLLATKAKAHEITLYVNAYAIGEVERWFTQHQHRLAHEALDDVLGALTIEPTPSDETIRWVRPHLLADPFDVEIVAGAISAKAMYLATFDQKHIRPLAPLLLSEFGIIVTTPGDIVELHRGLTF